MKKELKFAHGIFHFIVFSVSKQQRNEFISIPIKNISLNDFDFGVLMRWVYVCVATNENL